MTPTQLAAVSLEWSRACPEIPAGQFLQNILHPISGLYALVTTAEMALEAWERVHEAALR